MGSTAGEGCPRALKCWAAPACSDLMVVMGMLCPVETLGMCPMDGERDPAPTEADITPHPLLYPFLFLCIKHCTN